MTQENPILDATSFDNRIVIIPSKIADEGTLFLRNTLHRIWPDPSLVTIMPVSMGGDDLGNRLAGQKYQVNPIHMSHTGPNATYLAEAYCKNPPDYEKMLLPGNRTKPVVVVDGVIESQGTAKGIINEVTTKIALINTERRTSYPVPDFFFLALILKIADSDQVDIPNITGAFWVWKDIWVNGRGPDLDEKGRDETDVKGILSPRATTIPFKPYYKQLF